MMTKELAITLLQNLGDSEDKVATKLKEKGITGRIGNSTHCPVSNYLRKCGASGVSTIDSYIWLDDSDGLEVIKIDTTPAVKKFVRLFDTNHYPELIFK